jgi:ketosteroid isomerase-like protein
METSSVEVVRGVYEAFGRGDVPAVLGAMTDDIEWHEADGMPYGGVYHGPQTVAEKVFAPIVADVEGFTVTPEEMIGSGDTVAVVARYTGTGKVTGKSLDVPVTHVWEVREGKIARFRQFADTAQFLDVVPDEVATHA